MKISTLTKQAVIAIMIVILALAAFPAQPAHAAACSWDGSSSTAWTTGSNWTGCTGGGGVPANIDTITIPSGTPNQPTLGGPATIAGLTVNAGATLTLGNQQLTVNGPVSNAGTITASTGRLMQQVSGDFTNTGTVTFTGNGRIYFAGNVSNSGTLTLGSAEVRFYGAGAGPFTVAGFTTTGDIDWRRTGGTVTFAGNVSAAQLLMDNGGGEAGTLILGAGYTFTFPTVATISGVAFTNNGTLTVSTALSGTGLLTNSSSGTLNRTGGSSSITSLANAGIVNISGAATSSTAVANFTNTGTVNLNTTGTITGITNNAAGTVNLTNSGTITSFNNATATSTLNISDLTPPTITTLTVTAVGNTVNYSGPGAQTVRATAFRTLILSGSGAKTLPVGTSTTGNLRIMGTATATPTGTAITVNSLTLGTLGAGPASSTWGSLASAATNRTDTYFTTGTAGYLTITNDTRAAQSTLTITSPASMTFGDADATITTSGGSGTGAVTFNAGASTACSIVAGKLHVVSGTGTCNITATKAADGNYLSATSASFAVTISKANQAALTITAPASMTFGDADATITTSGGSGSGAVSFDAGASTACSIVAGNLHVLSGTGTCDITATKAADNDYNSTTSASFAVTINKANQAALSITAPASMTFGDADATIFTSGGTTSGTVTFNAGASTACSIVAGKLHILSGTGSCDITATMAGDADYNDVTSASFPVTINKANQATLTITAPASATFGDADATISTSGGTTGGSVTFNAGASTACSIVAGKLHVLSGTGTCAITATMAGDADYNDVTSASFPVTINKANQAALTITAPTSMTFGDADATITTTGGTTGGSVTFNAGASTACSIVAGKLHVVSGTGSCDITATMAGNTDYNDVTSASFPVTISKANQAALSITAPASATFGDADATITTSGGSGSGAVTFDAGASTACSIVAGKLHVVSGTGTCDITATKAADNDYNATTSASFPVTISKANQATLSITAPASATFGDPDATITTSGGSGSGAVTFDAGASTACSIVAGKLHVVSGTGTCDITATKAADNDYNATTSASFPVTVNKANQAALSITAPASMTYGDADATILTTGGTTGGSVTFNAGASTACSIVAGKLHVVSGTGSCDITATMAGNTDYYDVTSASFPVTINKANQAALTITAPASATFGDADATITTSGGSGSGAVTFDAGASTACSIVAGKLHVVSGTGTCDITATKATDNDYNATTSASFPVTINKANQAALSITAPASATFGDPDAIITTSGGSGSGAVTFDAGASTACSIVASKLHVLSVTGTCDITATKAADNDYNATTSASFPVTINKANQAALSITAPASMTFGDADAVITYTGGTTGGSVTFDAGASTACSIVAGKLHVVSGTGTCAITATMAGDADYNDVTSASFPVTINKANQATLTITAPASATFGDADATITTSGGSGSGAVSFDAGASTACSIVAGKLHIVSGTGTCDITATKAADNDYNATTSASFPVTINKADQATLTITGPAAISFGDPDATITTSGGSGSGAISFDSGASTACSIVAGKLHVISGTGTCDITATKAGDNDYNPTTSDPFTVGINKLTQATLTVTGPASITFGDADAVITYTGGSGSGAVSFSAGSSTACSIVSDKLHILSATGTCDITVHKAADADYAAATSDPFSVTLNKANQAALMITAPASMTYGDADATIVTSGGSGSGAISFDAGASTGCSIVSGKLHAISVAGTCDITATKAADNDYNATTSASFPVTINAKGLTVTADNQNINVGDPDPTFTFATVGFVAPDDFLTAPTCSVAGAHAAAGNYDITCSGADAGTNYSISYVKGTLTVTAVNNPPTDVSLSPASVNENQPVGTTVGALTTTDPDLTDTHTYAFCGGTDDASFQISGSNLQTNAVFDFETKSSYSICVRTDDGNGGAFDKTLAVTVNNLSETFTVTFKPNGGSGTMSPQTAGAPTALTLNAFTRAGYSFNGWNTTATGSGTAYTDGAVYSFAANLTLYAQWRPNPSANLLKSATFSAPTVFPYTWKVLGAQPSYASLLDCNIARSQPCSVRLTGGKGVDITILQMVKLAGKAGDTFSFGITNRANGVPATGGNFRVEVLFYKSWNTVIETSVIDLPTGTHDWRVYRGTVTAPADYTHIVFRFIYNKTRGSTWFDNAFLRKLP